MSPSMARPRKKPLVRKPEERRFGAHMSIAGGYENAVRAAQAVGFRSVQIFTKNNNQWKAPPLRPEQVEAFVTARQEMGIADTVAHTSYLINLASPDDVLWNRSIDAMVVEVERCGELGIPDLVVHPGAHMGAGEEAGFRRVALALDEIHGRTKGSHVVIDLETTAGQGSSIGHRFEHLQAILSLVNLPERLGICVDTCHIFAAGYSFDQPERYDGMIKQLHGAVGRDRVRVWHLNDSCRECGSRVDRHAAIGAGKMGLEPFRHLVNDPRFVNLPMILETPKGTEDGEDLDVRNLRTLREIVTS
jgi:deoxyribonuclease-4